MEDHISVKETSPNENTALPIDKENLPPTDSNILIFSNAIKMSVESLNTSITGQIKSSMNEINSSNLEMVKLLGQLTRPQQQTHPSYDGVCDSDKRNSQVHSSYDDTREHSPPRPAYSGGENQGHDFTNHGNVLGTKYYGSPHPLTPNSIDTKTAKSAFSSYSNLQKWSEQDDLSPHNGDVNVTPNNKKVGGEDERHDDDDNLSIHVVDDEFSQITAKIKTVDQTHTVTNIADDGHESIFKKYMDEFRPELRVGPPLDIDLAEAVVYFATNQLEPEKIQARQNNNMRPDNFDISTKLTNKTIFTLHCGDASFARNTDVKLQKVQNQVVSAIYPIVRAVDYLKQLNIASLGPTYDKLMEGVILLTNTLQNTDQMRRDLYKNVLPVAWKGLVNKPEHPTTELFGDIDTRIKDLQNDQKILVSLQEAKASDEKDKKKLGEKNKFHGSSSTVSQPKKARYDQNKSSDYNNDYHNTGYPKNVRGFPQTRGRPSGRRGNRRSRRGNYY